MDISSAMFILFGLFIFCLVIKVPIALALCIAGIVFNLATNLTTIDTLTQTVFATADNFPLLAVPFFILAGELMGGGGIAKRLVSFAQTIVGQRVGGLGMIAILCCMVFAAISGSGTATVAAIGAIMIPTMIASGYKPGHAASIVACGGALGPIIPPSILFVIYGVIANVSISKLFLGGVLPGALVTLAMLVMNRILCQRENYPVEGARSGFKDILAAFNQAKFALLAPVVVLGGIYGGVFTPTEAAVISVVYCLLVGLFVHKELKIRDIPEIFMHSAMVSATILIIMGPASYFSKCMAIAGIPQLLAGQLQMLSSSPLTFLLIVNVLLVAVGMMIEGVAALTILTPLLIPIALAYNIDPLHFGVILTVNLSFGLFTPPFGLNLFLASKIADIPFPKTFPFLWPQMIAVFAALALIVVFPFFSTWLPAVMR